MEFDLQRCIEGDQQAWDQFVKRTTPIVAASIRKVIRHRQHGGEERIADAIQDTYLKLLRDDYRVLRTFDPDRASIATWLTIIARNIAIDLLRKRQLPSAPIDQIPPIESPENHPETARSTPQIPRHLLSERQQLVLRILFDDQKTVAEAAIILGVDQQTIRSTKHKAITRLRTFFKQQSPSDQPETDENSRKPGET